MPEIKQNGNIIKDLHLFNSLTQRKELFKTVKEKTITWYCCGPTVYDSAHMGHARSYISFDIIRRIFSQYFNYNVIFVMNITDIDDKIITKARREYLWGEFKKYEYDATEILNILKNSFQIFQTKIEKTTDADLKSMREKRCEIIKSNLNDINLQYIEENYHKVIVNFKDIISEYLDNTKGNTIIDHEIFFQLTRKYEKEFLEDIQSLGIMMPTFMPRVSECIEDIIKYISAIISNGYAYESKGSVYFDTISFTKNHKYAKLMPSAAQDINNLATGEGELAPSINSIDKKSSRDFALWKSSKPGEPSWLSPWGNGRPGWHIECSTMCNNILPQIVDIHSGGVDLKFPHHDNEIAQSEAYYDSHNWINYFLHTGHLTIESCKMSKSLKNFISIKDALQQYTSRQIRMAFILHQWNGPLDFCSNMMSEACSLDKKISEFIFRISNIIHDIPSLNDKNPYGVLEKELHMIYVDSHEIVHSCICDNIDTPGVVLQIKSLMSATNNYIVKKNYDHIYSFLISSIIKYIQYIFSTFGADFSTENEFNAIINGHANHNLTVQLANEVAKFRSDVRKIALFEKNPDILSLCDSFRDIGLFDLGVKLEDKGMDQKPTVLISTKEDLIKEREELQRIEQKKKDEIFLKNQHKEQVNNRKKTLASIHPSEMFVNEIDKYSKFDDNGIPILDASGNPLSKSAMKKIIKRYEEQKSIHERFMCGNG